MRRNWSLDAFLIPQPRFADVLVSAMEFAGLNRFDFASEAEIPVARLLELERGHANPTPDEVWDIWLATNWRQGQAA